MRILIVRLREMIKNIILLASTIGIIALFFIVLEGTVRYYYPDAHHQNTELSLYKANVFEQSFGWKPNSTGVSFGMQVDIDEYGFREMTVPDHYDESWIILGDSVGFGVGVKTEALFSQLLQSTLGDKRIWNTSVVGYALPDYRNVMDSLLKNRTDITKVILIYCLNDMQPNLTLTPKIKSAKEKIRSFLERNSKLYILLQASRLNRSETYAPYYNKLYSSDNPRLNDYLDVLVGLDSMLKEKKIDFTVIVMPFDYQLRMTAEEYLKPQQVLGDFMKKNNIHFINAYNYFNKENESENYYLYSDKMHLSEHGHRKLFELIYSNLSIEDIKQKPN